jgi:hypothetical protein
MENSMKLNKLILPLLLMFGCNIPTNIQTAAGTVNEQDNTQIACRICYQTIPKLDDKIVTTFPCNHKIHTECLEQWQLSGNYDNKCCECQKRIEFDGLEEIVDIAAGYIKEEMPELTYEQAHDLSDEIYTSNPSISLFYTFTTENNIEEKKLKIKKNIKEMAQQFRNHQEEIQKLREPMLIWKRMVAISIVMGVLFKTTAILDEYFFREEL